MTYFQVKCRLQACASSTTIGISILDAYVISIGLGLWCLTPLSTTFQLYRGGTPRH